MVSPMLNIRTEKCDVEAPTATRLIAELDAELDRRYPEDEANFFDLESSDVTSGSGAFMIAYINDTPVGCGAVRKLDNRDFEIKRMYVVPSFRGQGISKVLLAVLESEAQVLGASRLVLETGNRQPEALALYRGSGYSDIPRFGQYINSPLSVCMAKEVSE